MSRFGSRLAYVRAPESPSFPDARSALPAALLDAPMTPSEIDDIEGERSLPAPVPYEPTSPWGGLSIYQVNVAEKMHRAAPELSLRVIRAAVSWIRAGELERHYGVAYALAYSLRAALREGALVVRDD